MINPVQSTPAASMPSAFSAVPKGPSRFARVFGGIMGGALNLVAPGAGSLVGSFIGGGGADFTSMQGILQQSAAQQMRMLAIQNQVQTQTQEFTTVSNLLKARHDGEMSAVHNFKS